MKVRYMKKPGNEPWWERLNYGQIYEPFQLYGTQNVYVAQNGENKNIFSYIIEDHRNQYTYWPISDFETVEEYRDKQIEKLLEDVK